MMQKQWRLAARPDGIPDRSHFDLSEVPIPELEPGKAVVKTLYLGVAPVMLRYMRNETEFESPLALGSVMAGRGVAQVVESDCDSLPVGAIVQARLGWQEYALIDASHHPAPFLLPTDLRCRMALAQYRYRVLPPWLAFAILAWSKPMIEFLSRAQQGAWAVMWLRLPKPWARQRSLA